MRGPFGTGVRKEIRKEWESFSPTTLCSVGNGKKVRFLKDFWCEEEPLALTSPSLFSLAINKKAMVTDVWDPIGKEGGGPLISPNLSMIRS